MFNILYVHSHDTGRYIQPYGHAVRTPNLMQLAREGTLFRQAYAAAPTCSASRSAMLTGVEAHSCGMVGLAHRGFSLTESARARHLANVLHASGYETALCGVQHEIERGREAEIGYEKVLAVPKGSATNMDLARAHAAADFIRSTHDRPFFLSVGLNNTHREFPELTEEAMESEDTNPNYVKPAFPFYDSPKNREDMARYNLSAHIVDDCVGILIAALKEAGRESDTVVMYTTDHGIAFPHCKCNLYDVGIGVSLMMRYPNNPSSGGVVDALVSHLDVYPTLCELAGVEQPEGLAGRSLVPLLTQSATRVRDAIFAEVSYHAGYEPQRCVRTERYKLIRYYDDHDGPVPVNIDDGATKSFLVEHGLLDQKREREFLFDLYLDPVERVNRIADPAYAQVRQDLEQRLDVWMTETDDPLVHFERVPKPEGARVNLRTAISPRGDEFE